MVVFLIAVYVTLTAVVLQSMICLFYDKSYGAMMKYDDRYDVGNEDRNDDNNSASGSGSVGTIFDPIITPRSCGGLSVNGGDGAAAAAH